MTDDYPKTKQELLDRIAAARAELDATVNPLSDDEFSAGSTPTDWSVKDHLAHLGAWAVGIAALLNHQPRWAAMNLDADFVRGTSNFDEINDVLYHQHKDKTPAEVKAYFNDCHNRIVNAIDSLEYADLLRPYNDYQPHNNPESGKNPIIGWIAGDSYEHYPEHLPWIQEHLARIRSGQGASE